MRTNHFFLACHSTCAECSGSLSTQCTKCDPPTTLSAGVCQPCPDGSFYSSVTSNCQGKFFPTILVIMCLQSARALVPNAQRQVQIAQHVTLQNIWKQDSARVA